MKLYGQLEAAALENLSSAPSAGVIGRVWFNTTTGKMEIDDGTLVRAMLRNDGKAIIGNSGTAADNARFHRGAASVLQILLGNDATAEGTLSTALAQVSSRVENYATGSLPTFGNAGRLLYDSTLNRFKYDNGSAILFLDGSNLTTKGDLLTYSTLTTRQAVGTDGQVLTADSGQTTGLTWATPGASNNSSDLTNVGVAASVAANAMTISLKQADGTTDPSGGASAVKVSFRDSTLTTGGYTNVSTTSAITTVISSGSTGGSVSAKSGYIYVYAINNAGTLELAWSGSKRFDTGSLVSTTAEGGAGGADSRFTLYSTTARSNVPCRLIGRIKSTQATAGTWATSPSEISIAPFDTARRSLLANGATGTLDTSFNTITYSTVASDPDSAYSSGVYTVQETADYDIAADYLGSGTMITGSRSVISIFVNGTELYSSYVYIAGAQGNVYCSISKKNIFLNEGDTVEIKSTEANISGPSLNTDVKYGSICINKSYGE